MNYSKTKIIIFSVGVLFAASCTDDNNSGTAQTVVIPTQTIIQDPIILSHNDDIAIIAGSSITNTGQTTVTGDMALSPGTSVGGFPSGVLNGTLRINDTIAVLAKLDLVAAYIDAKDRQSTQIFTLSGNIGGLTLTPGLYKSTSSLAISSGDLTFDAKGDANAIFIIQIASSFTTTSGRKVILKGSAQASNIYWQVSSSATFGTTSVMKGTIMALESITFQTGATLDGKALSRNGSVTLDANTIVSQ